MTPLGATQILELCDADGRAGKGERALALLKMAIPGAEVDEISLGSRDALLMALYQATFAPQAALVSSCRSCGEKVEYALAAGDLELHPPQTPCRPAEPVPVECASHRLLVRPVTARAMARAGARCSSPAQIRRHLLEDCVAEVDGVPGAALPPEAEEEVERVLAELDPLADIELEHICPHCGTRWSELFDPVDLVWNEVLTHGFRLMSEIEILARTFHWSERDILALPARRRQVYLESALR